MVAENEQFVFVVTHVEAEGQFLRIWAQTDETVVQSVASMLLPLQEKFEFYTADNLLSPDNVQPQTRCCARGISKEFARAKILNLRSDGMVLVQFVDYGNIIYVPIHNIRLLENIREASYLFSLPEAATPFVLADVIPIGGSWLGTIVDKIRSILVNNKYHGVYQNVGNLKALKFKMMQEDFSETLVKRNMAIYSRSCPSIQQMIPPISVQPLRTPHSINNMQQENWRSPAPQNIAQVHKVVKTNSFKAIQLEIGSVHDVQISYVEDGPSKFSIQLVESIPYLQAMMEKINSQSHLPLQEPPIAGTVCLGRQTHTNKLCRVVLNSPGDTSCKAYFADYGHHEVLQFSNIYQIPDEFVVPNVFSIRFTLSGIINWIIPQDMKDYFGGIVANENLKLRVCKGPMSPLTQYGELYIRGKNIKDILSETFPNSCEFVYDEPKRLQEGTKNMVVVTYVDSVTKFFVQMESDHALLNEVMRRIQQVSKSAKKLTPAQIRPEMPCIALYNMDSTWYRACVISMVDNDKARVFYVDYGNEEIISIHNLRAIPTDLVRALPKQAIKCSLNGFKSGGPLDKEFTKAFESLVLEESLCLIVLNNLPNTVVVNLYEEQNASNASTNDIAAKLKAVEISMKPEMITASDRQVNRSLEASHKVLQSKNQNDNGMANWEKEPFLTKSNNFEPYENSKSKFRKDNENEQRYDNRLRKGSSEYSNGPQNNRFDKELSKPDRFGQNDRFGNDTHKTTSSINDRLKISRYNNEANDFRGGRSGKENTDVRPSINSRLDRSFNSDKGGSDKDSDTSSRSGGRRNNRDGRRSNDDERKRDLPANNRNRIGRWESEEKEQEAHRKNYNGNASISPNKSRSPRDNFDKSKSPVWDTSLKTTTTCSKDSSRYITSTPISKIPPPNITIGAVKNCVLVYYTNPLNFYVQLCPDNKDLISMMDKIYSIYEDGGKVLQRSEIIPDLQCIAQYSEDEQWYRAVIKSVESTSATVYFVDYGNDETVSFNKIKEIEPEFLKLPAQAVHCKLFCPMKSSYNTEESDELANKTDGIEVEAEFVAEENGIYHVLLRELDSKNLSSKGFINDMFANGVNLIKEKEMIRNKCRTGAQIEKSSPEYATFDEKWLENKLDLGTGYNVIMAWFINPENFYCQLVDKQKEFRDMMNEIQSAYVKRQPVSETLKVGSSVIAVLPDDGVLYRAQILELNKPRGHVVQYIDYGDRAMVDPRNIYPVERKFMLLPRQAIFCGLKNIACIPGSNWSNASEISKFFGNEKFDCIFHEHKDNKYLISLTNNGTDIARAIVEKNLAVFSSTSNKGTESLPEDSAEVPEVPRIDISLLEGQTLYVKVSNVDGVGKFYVQFYTAEACQSAVDTYMSTKNSQMLALPGKLALMQNQAIECALFDVSLSSKADDTLKNLVTGQDVKIFVEKVELNRLVVRLFDINGNKIKVVETQNTEKISPICNMQILESTHQVNVSLIKNSNSIWLQRTSEVSIQEQLLKELADNYTNTNDEIVPEENQIYAGRCANGWYRVKVIKINENKCLVNIIDNGHLEDIPINNLRMLKPQFYLPHQLAIEVSLPLNLAGSDMEQVKILEPFLAGKILTATFFNVNRKWIVELSENGEKLSEKLSALKVVKETTKTKFIYVELPDMVVGEKYKVVVSYHMSPKQLWLHRYEDLNAIDDMQDQLQEDAVKYSDYDGIPEEKSLCLAMYSLDELWYRAEVLDADAEITTVRFIDYGNTDVINNNVSKVKQLPEKWKAIKKYAIECKLDVLPINTDDWSDEACIRLSDLVNTDDPLDALIITDKAPMRIDLYSNGESICKTLVDEKLAAYVQSSEELDEEIIDEVQRDPRSAYVSNIVSLEQFWIQEEKSVNDLEMIEDRLMMASIFPSVEEIKEGLICIAHFPEDNLYYRAMILSHNDEGTRVRYIDYGNSAITKDLRQIPEDLAKIQPLSRKCCLAKPDGIEQWSDRIQEEFVNIAACGATIFLLDVIEEGETCLVKLTLEDKDVAIELLKMCEEHAHIEDESCKVTEDIKDIVTVERLSPIGEENSKEEFVYSFSYINSPADFWLQNKKFSSELNNMLVQLENAENFDIAKEINEGKILAAKFDEDGHWYRSKVLSHGESGTEVFYIDYGNSAIAESSSSLRELPEELALVPPLSIQCSLKLPEGFTSWSKRACEKFIDLSTDSSIEFRYKILDKISQVSEDKPLTILLMYEDQNVADIIVKYENENPVSESLLNEKDEYELKEPKDINSTGDSAIQSLQSEMDHHINEIEAQDNTSVPEESAPIQILSKSIEILHETRLCNNSIESSTDEQVIEVSCLTNKVETKVAQFNKKEVLTYENSV